MSAQADSTRLAGLLPETEFAAARADFERRLELCHDKFRKQDAVWVVSSFSLIALFGQKLVNFCVTENVHYKIKCLKTHYGNQDRCTIF